jgi:hypothetical protein
VHNRYFCGRGHGVFVEMGALDGLRYSNTKLFEESPLDWRGVLVEANPVNAAKVPRNRPHATLVAEAACPEVGDPTHTTHVFFRLYGTCTMAIFFYTRALAPAVYIYPPHCGRNVVGWM